MVDLGGGTDTLKLANGTNSATVSNVETVLGGSGTDTITLGNVANTVDVLERRERSPAAPSPMRSP